MSVARICQRQVDCAQAGESAWQAAERMHQRTVGTLVVVDESRAPIGIVTDRDLVVRVLAAGKDPYATTIGEVMTREVHTAAEDAPLELVLAMMRNGAFRRVPVVSPRGQLMGLVSLDDILLLMAEEFSCVGELLEAQAPAAIEAV